MKEKLILGTAQLGMKYGINNSSGQPSQEEADKILQTAWDNHIRFLDSAEAYGDAHKRIGNFHGKVNFRFNIITKFFPKNFQENLQKKINQDLQELSVASLYAYLFHNLKDLEEFAKEKFTLWKLKEKGLLQKIGVSLYTNEEVEYVLQKYPFVELIQIPFNILDNYNLRKEVLLKMKDKNIEVHTRSVYLQGVFFMNTLPPQLQGLSPYINTLKSLAEKYNLSLQEIALNYVLSQKLIDKVLIGVDNAEQLLENLQSVRKTEASITEEINKSIFVREKKLLNPANW